MKLMSASLLAALIGTTAVYSADDFPPRFSEYLSQFQENKTTLHEIQREMKKDGVPLIVRKYLFDGPDAYEPKLTLAQAQKYEKLLKLVPFVASVDDSNGWLSYELQRFEIGSDEYSIVMKYISKPFGFPACRTVDQMIDCPMCSAELDEDWYLEVMRNVKGPRTFECPSTEN